MEEMVRPTVPGIIEASVAITAEPDGRVSFRVLIGAASGRPSECDVIELIISPEHVSCALAGTKIRALAGSETAHEPAVFPCHIGLYCKAVHTA
jgi:hypothetical protein